MLIQTFIPNMLLLIRPRRAGSQEKKRKLNSLDYPLSRTNVHHQPNVSFSNSPNIMLKKMRITLVLLPNCKFPRLDFILPLNRL